MTATSGAPVPSLPELYATSPLPRRLATQSPSQVVDPFAADTTSTLRSEAPASELALSSMPPRAPAPAAVPISSSTSATIPAHSLHNAENKQILVPQQILGPNGKIKDNGRTSPSQITSVLSAGSSPSTLRESSHGSFNNFCGNQAPSKLLKRSFSATKDSEEGGIQPQMDHRLDYPPNFDYTPGSPAFVPDSPHYAPQSPKYIPAKPVSPFLSPTLGTAGPNSSLTIPNYCPPNSEISLTSPRFSTASPQYAPQSPRFSPKSPAYRPLSPKRRRTGSGELGWKPASHTVNYEDRRYRFNDLNLVMTPHIIYHAPLDSHSSAQSLVPGRLSTSSVNEMSYHDGEFSEVAPRDKEFDMHNSDEENCGAHFFGGNHSAEIFQSVHYSGGNDYFRDIYLPDDHFWRTHSADDQHSDGQVGGNPYGEAYPGINQYVG